MGSNLSKSGSHIALSGKEYMKRIKGGEKQVCVFAGGGRGGERDTELTKKKEKTWSKVARPAIASNSESRSGKPGTRTKESQGSHGSIGRGSSRILGVKKFERQGSTSTTNERNMNTN